MTAYYLCPHIRYCRVDDGLVVLNIETQKYLALPAECRRLFDLIASDRVVDTRPDAVGTETSLQESVQSLLDAKIITSTKPSTAPHVTPHVLATSSLMATSFSKPLHPYRPKAVFALAAAIACTSLNLRRGQFGQIAADLLQRKSQVVGSVSARSAAEVIELFRVFRWLRMWSYTAAGVCLFDSLVTAEFFLRHRIATTLCLGVQSKPFGAHAWVQWHDVVVNDTVENVRRYTPIMSI